MTGSKSRDVDEVLGRSDPLDAREDGLMETHATAEQIRAAVATTPISLLLGILASFLVAGFADQSSGEGLTQDRLSIWSWWLSVAATFGFAFVVCSRFNQSEREPQKVIDTVLRGRAWLSVVIACATAVGAASWVFLPSPNPRVEMTVIAYMVAMMAAHGGSQASYPPLMFRFLGPTVAVFVIGLWRLDDRFYTLAGVGFIVFAIGIYFYTSTQARVARKVIVLKRQANLARQEAEAARREADWSNEGKTAFLAVVGHDLRQPMHALVQYHAHLRRQNQDPKMSRTIEQFGISLDAMQDLLNSILDVSKLMTGSVTPTLTHVRMGDIFDRIEAQMRILADDKGLRFDMRHDDSWVESDEVLLERILRNLILNAIRYTSEGSIGVRANRRSGSLIVRVFDTGVGISRGEQEKIFEYFYQVGNEARNRRHGLGLGLAIVRQLAKLLSVRVGLRSRPGRGSIFRLTMTAVDSAPETSG